MGDPMYDLNPIEILWQILFLFRITFHPIWTEWFAKGRTKKVQMCKASGDKLLKHEHQLKSGWLEKHTHNFSNLLRPSIIFALSHNNKLYKSRKFLPWQKRQISNTAIFTTSPTVSMGCIMCSPATQNHLIAQSGICATFSCYKNVACIKCDLS